MLAQRQGQTQGIGNIGNIWDDVKAQAQDLMDSAKSAMTPDSWTTATRILPWAVGGVFALLILSSMKGKR